MTVRAAFNADPARKLAAQAGFTQRWSGKGASARFAYFEDDEHFVVVGGAQEKGDTDRAFALGLSLRGDRRLVLILPAEHAFATLQRAPWFTGSGMPTVWLHDGSTAERMPLPSMEATVIAVREREAGVTPAEELGAAMRPHHLRAASAGVADLVEWAVRDERLDHGHRQSERSWHCDGLKVLSVKSASGGGSTVRAGVHYSKADQAPQPLRLARRDTLTANQLLTLQVRVEKAIADRRSGVPPLSRADEHWLQSVIRRDPSLVGVEQPALREVPAWRPRGSSSHRAWGRGYVDLLGLDGHGDIRIVETKLATNDDELLIFQGLDYYIWAQAYRETLLDRLGASPHAAFEIHYVVGADEAGKVHVSRHAPAQVASLDPSIRWRCQTVKQWYGPAPAPDAEMLRARTLPGSL